MLEIRPLSTVPDAAVEDLLDAAFGADRHGRTAYRLREGVLPVAALSFAALLDGRLAGTLQSWPVALATPGGRRVPLTLVGPVAVRPDVQRAGIGRALMDALLSAADAGRHDALVMIGDPEYYGRFFGFTAAATAGWSLPGPWEPHRLLARITRPGGVPADGALGPDPAFASARLSA